MVKPRRPAGNAHSPLRLRYLLKRYWLWGVAAIGLLVLVWGIRAFKRDPQNWQYVKAFDIRLPMHYPLHGIDVSHHNSRINWQRVRTPGADGLQLQFVFIKATEGATHIDRQFKRNWREAKSVGMRRGAYHFYHPRRDPVKQAEHFIKQVRLEPGDFAPVLDIEINRGVSSDELISGLRTWLETVEAHYNVRPIIYTNAHFYRQYIAGNFDEYPLWIADYSNTKLGRYNHDRLYLWQHNQNGKVKGIPGRVDFNVFVTDPDRLAEICL